MSRLAASRAVVLGFFALFWLAGSGSVSAREFRDAAGRSVTVPDHVQRVLPAGPPADLLLFSIAPDVLVGLVKPWSDAQKPYIPETYRNLGQVPRINRDISPADLEKVRALEPDLIVDYGDVTAAYAAIADKIQAATGIPYVVLDGKLDATPKSVRKLGGLLGRGDRAEEVAHFSEDTLARVAAALANIGPSQRIPVYYARGEDGLQAVRPNNINGEFVDHTGGKSVVQAGAGTFVKLSLDEVRALVPTTIVVANAKAVRPDAPLRQAFPLAAFLVDRGEPFGWVDPPSLNRLVGMLWLASRLFPDRVQLTPADVTAVWKTLFAVDVPADEVAKALLEPGK